MRHILFSLHLTFAIKYISAVFQTDLITIGVCTLLFFSL